MQKTKALEQLGFENGLKAIDNEHTLKHTVGNGFEVIVSKSGQADITVKAGMIEDKGVKAELLRIAEDFQELLNTPDEPETGEAEIVKPEPVKPEKKMDWAAPGKKLAEKKRVTIPVSMQDRQVQDLNISDIKHYICEKATDQEAYMFLKLCQARGLNPFTREAYLIKYKSTQPATTVVGKDAFTRRAEANPQFDGYEAGIILRNESGEIERREGTFILKSETLLGGWAKVYRKDRAYPFVSEVSFDEYAGTKAEYVNNQPTGNKVLNSMWEAHGPTMIRKVPLVQSLREAFPGELGGLYDSVEINQEEDY